MNLGEKNRTLNSITLTNFLLLIFLQIYIWIRVNNVAFISKIITIKNETLVFYEVEGLR